MVKASLGTESSSNGSGQGIREERGYGQKTRILEYRNCESSVRIVVGYPIRQISKPLR